MFNIFKKEVNPNLMCHKECTHLRFYNVDTKKSYDGKHSSDMVGYHYCSKHNNQKLFPIIGGTNLITPIKDCGGTLTILPQPYYNDDSMPDDAAKIYVEEWFQLAIESLFHVDKSDKNDKGINLDVLIVIRLIHNDPIILRYKTISEIFEYLDVIY
jgi:hypothetical protein